MLRRVGLIILIAFISFSLITGCRTKPTAVPPTEKSDKPSKTAEPEKPAPAKGFKGRTLVQGIPDQALGYPVSVHQGKDGTIYILDVYATDGMIKKFNVQGKFLGRFGKVNDGLKLPVDLTVDSDGNAYVADMDKNKVIVLSQNGEKQGEIGPGGDEENQFIPRSVALDPDGNLLVLSFDSVWRFSPSGELLSKFGGRGDGPGEFGAEGSEFYLGPNSLDIDSSGNIYVADTLNLRIQVFSPKGDFIRQIDNEDTEGIFTEIYDIAVDDDGYVYVTDTGSYNVYKLDKSGKISDTLGGMGSREGRFGCVGIEGIGPTGISMGQDGTLIAVDPYNHRIEVFSRQGDFLNSVGTSVPISFIYPHNVAVDSGGNLLVTAGDQYYIDPLNFKALKFDSSGRLLNELVSGYNSGRFVNPTDIETGPSDHIYVLDVDMVQRFDSKGRFLVNFGGRGGATGNFGIADLYGVEFGPTGVAVDEDGNIYVCDIYNSRIQKFSPSHQFIDAIGFADPFDLVIDDSGNMYVLNSRRASITKLDPDGRKLIEFGRYGTDAEALALSDETGELTGPQGIFVDSQGRVYIADTYNHRIVRYTKSGEFDTAFGEFGSEDGQLAYPRGIVLNSNNELIVADYGNHRIQKFLISD